VDKILWDWEEMGHRSETSITFWESGGRPTFWLRLRLAFRLLFYAASPSEAILDERQTEALIAALQAPAQPVP
jgi:hypothetical protein